MLHLGENRARNKLNVLKKVKVDGQWKLCPAVLEADGKLKDRVQINGRAEVHNKGVYYIEWRENGRRLRQSVPNRNHVLERARLKALEYPVLANETVTIPGAALASRPRRGR
jgi:hypothetical protein